MIDASAKTTLNRWHIRIPISLRFSPKLVLFRLLVVAFFWQIWFEVAGITVRLEDIIAISMIGCALIGVLARGKLRFYRNPLNKPLVLWGGIILLGVAVTLQSPFSMNIKKDALVNGIRLILMVGVFFVLYNSRGSVEGKYKAFYTTILKFSVVTTTISILQIGYWDGWLSLPLPEILVTLKENANTERGREIFALYLGNTGSHTWSAMLAMQALLVWVTRRNLPNLWRKRWLLLYFAILVLILARVSVRNSIVGLIVSIIAIEIISVKWTRNFANHILRAFLILVGLGIIIYLLLNFASDSYFVERIRSVVPTIQNGEIILSRSSNIYGRFEYWNIAMKMFWSSPIVGIGFYSFEEVSKRFSPNPIVHAHNSYFQTLAELGILGGVALGILIISVCYFFMMTRRRLKLHRMGLLGWEYALSVSIFMAFTMAFSNTLWSPTYVGFFILSLAMLVNLVRTARHYA